MRAGSASGLLARLVAGLTASMPKAFTSFGPPKTRLVGLSGRSRTPDGNRSPDGCHRGTSIRHSAPGAKLLRRAHERRLSLSTLR